MRKQVSISDACFLYIFKISEYYIVVVYIFSWSMNQSISRYIFLNTINISPVLLTFKVIPDKALPCKGLRSSI